MRRSLLILAVISIGLIFIKTGCKSPSKPETVAQEVMQRVYDEVKTPYKYGLILVPPHDTLKYDCPTVFFHENKWHMTYVVFDGQGYETWLSESEDLLNWDIKGKIMSFNEDTTAWDRNQAAGYNSLQDLEWGGSYELQKFDNKYWLSYFGGNSTGYEKGLLSISMAFTEKSPIESIEWDRLGYPVLSTKDENVRWWENSVMYKSSVIWDKENLTGYPFLMYYNARGDSLQPNRGAERIGIAGSHDMIHWDRFITEPLLNHHKGITGDAVIQKMGDLYVMFYFGAFWPGTEGISAWNRFACSYDLVNWTDWNGAHLIEPTEEFDGRFAHKSFVIKHDGVVYHFYNAVNEKNQRGIAVATSKDMGKSNLEFGESEGMPF
ncbi:MAG TPA: hypothetical protein VKY45_13690 [Marinilabiliaceae bacterium]|nr:hypothetical protein [Marinilabiliaceae bacterium]